MEKKTMGAFISALRKAKGLTQQDVADKLNVSNKAVSRWERDECAPDISLIPAIAEMLEVTCDELLKGERIFSEAKEEKNGQKVERQIRALVNREISSFKTFICISLALSAAGLICLYCIAYGFYRPIVAFFAALIFFIASAVVSLIGTEKMKEMKNGNELFESADEKLTERFNKTLEGYSLTAFSSVVCAFALSLPILICRDKYFVESVISFGSYMQSAAVILLLFTLVIIYAKDAYFAFVTGNKQNSVSSDTEIARVKPSLLCKMNIVQISCVIASALMFISAPLITDDPDYSLPLNIMCIIGFVFIALNVLCFSICIVKNKNERVKIIPTGLRNSVLSVAAILAVNIFEISYTSDSIYDGSTVWQKVTRFDAEGLIITVIFVLSVCVLFKIVDKLVEKRKR